LACADRGRDCRVPSCSGTRLISPPARGAL
jgi:hypothetical protein